MLDTVTKRRIDTARDILVGKVPDPKSQVEQITIALIYKFMDDMDAGSEELGGRRKFFADGFARYGWSKLMRSGLGGHETLNLYAEAIARMPENPGIPPLFRDIFKNAYLPYRDPETLRAFLKIIDEFEYDHSERLGDAYEYLLSVLSSQGDAGQFRTPRHIIDFIVEIVEPRKNETVLDPACGTAGFLISSWKHILRTNTAPDGSSNLTPEERGRLAQNFRGYDISPDMVRLSLVNMYLHGFTDPHIFEYDTLTSLDRWNEHADIILANPPFMSPKGGIKPHNRFSVQSKRSEVLFVDYMAEHLTPNGRAGIIVPEGIIFQSQTAYKQLRRMLVEESLVAVISLPAGVFNPYSGVKTSILILDKALARQSDTIGFFKIENDGFGLGAQRRAIEKNDLPQAQAEIGEYVRHLRTRESTEDFQPVKGLIVLKEKIAANGDYNLSGERYREDKIRSSTYPLVPIGEICNLTNGRAFTPEDWKDGTNGGLQIVRIQNLNAPDNKFNYYTGEVSDRHIINSGELLFSWSGSRGTSFGAHIWRGGKAVLNQHIFKVDFDDSRLTKIFLLHALNKAVSEVEENLHGGVGLVHITKGNLEKIKIPIPPLEVQKEIVGEIEVYQKVIDGARAVIDNYRPHIPINPEWPMVPIREVASVESGFGFPLTYQGQLNQEIPFLKVSDMNLPGNETRIVSWNNTVSREDLRQLKGKTFPAGTIIFPKIGAAIATNKKRILTQDSTYDNNVMGIVPNEEHLLPKYLHTYLLAFDLSLWASEAQPPSMRKTVVEDHKLPVPSLSIQKTIVTEIEAEQTLINANRDLISRMEKKIQDTLARVWGENNDPG